MREIKFRAWNDTDKKMIMLDKDRTYDDGRIWTTLVTIHYDNLMQYTGIKDKNGVEIYENDIIELDADWMKITNETKKLCLVSFMHGAFIYTPCDYKLEMISFLWSVAKHCIVVGNIYEFPKLSKATEQPANSI